MRIESFEGRVAVVTGAASGIGRGIAAALGAAGATVVVADVDAVGAGRAAAELGGVAWTVDVTDPASVQALAEGVSARFGRVDIVVNNAGVGPLATFEDLTLADFHWVLDINFWGVVHGVQSFLPLLSANPDGGYLVNTASVAALLPAAGTAAYAASKAAVLALSETLAVELADADRVGVSVLLPAPVRTSININSEKRPGHHEGAAKTEEFLPPIPLLEPEDVGSMVVDALRAGRLHVFTHPQTRGPVEARLAALAEAHPQVR